MSKKKIKSPKRRFKCVECRATMVSSNKPRRCVNCQAHSAWLDETHRLVNGEWVTMKELYMTGRWILQNNA